MSAVELPDINQYVNRGKSNQSEKRRMEQQKYQKLASVKSVDKFIKNNDLSSVIGRDNNYYPKQLEDQRRIDEVSEVHSNLNGLKKSCDELKRKAQLKEKEIEKMRKDIDQMTRVEEGYNLTVEGMQKRFDELTLEYQTTKDRQNNVVMTMKTYEQMLSRMKKDSLIYKLRMNQMELQLNKKLITLTSKTDESQKLKEETQKAEHALQEVVEGIEQQNLNREKNLQRFKDDLRFKQEVERKREERVKRQAEIAEVAANDIRDSNLKKWRKLLLVHKFLNQFLRLKMQREIKKFQSVEQGFQKIKAATGVTDANEIVRKFLGREQTYSHLLISIAEYEKRIDQIRRNNEDLKSQLSKLKNDIGNAERSESTIKRDLEQDKQVVEIEERALNSSLLMSKLSQWIEKNLTKLARVGLVEVPDEENPRFGLLINLLRQNLLTMNEDEQEALIAQQIKNQREEIYESEFQRRNVRVKPSGVPKYTQGNSFSHERPPSAPENDPHETSGWEYSSKIDEDEDKNLQEEEDHFKNLRDDVKVDGKKKK